MQSHTPGVACSISNGQSLAGSANVTGAMVSCSPGTETILHTFGCCATDGELPNGNLIMDSAGDLYGTTDASGGANTTGTVFKIN